MKISARCNKIAVECLVRLAANVDNTVPAATQLDAARAILHFAAVAAATKPKAPTQQ